MTRLIFATAAAALAGVFLGPTAQAYEAPWCAMIQFGTGSVALFLPASRSATVSGFAARTQEQATSRSRSL